jgi:6-phosphogluconolactonase
VTRLTTCADAEAVAQRAASEIARRLQAACSERQVAHIALSGGTTPARTYELLGGMPELWQEVDVWFADERCVPPQDDQSNYRLVAGTLLQPAGIAEARVHRMEGELGPETGAQRYAEALRARIAGEPGEGNGAGQGPPVLDVIVLGIGEDGHVASLFPGSSTLQDEHEVCLPVHDAPKPPPERITLSLGVLRAARRCVLLATGAAKARAVSAMLAEPTPAVPASLLQRERLTVIVDDAAAPSPGSA